MSVFSADRAAALIEEFCRTRRVVAETRFTVVPNLAEALEVIHLKGPDRRWLKAAGRGAGSDVPAASSPAPTSRVERRIFETAVGEGGLFQCSSRPWFLSHTLTSTAHWARVSTLMRAARGEGIGWILPARRHVVLVPLPTMTFAEGQPEVLHDDTGRRAVEWADGSGSFYLQGIRFDAGLYRKVVGNELSFAELCLLPNADHRSIALSYMTFDDLVRTAGAQLIDVGQRGTKLYRLALPDPLIRDRPENYGPYDYFIHMRDASHPDREFIEWVDPRVGTHRDAELCQAHAFGISLQDWLSIEQAG